MNTNSADTTSVAPGVAFAHRGGSTPNEPGIAGPDQAHVDAASAEFGLAALAVIARLHHVAVEPAALRHELGLGESDALSRQDLLLAARHLGLKAKATQTSAERLTLVPLPALAQMNDGRLVVLAQCDGQRVLFLDPASWDRNAGGELSAGPQAARPTIEPLEVFLQQWSGELILITSRASLAGELARFDFSWFIPSIVRHRKLLGEVLMISLFLQLFALVLFDVSSLQRQLLRGLADRHDPVRHAARDKVQQNYGREAGNGLIENLCIKTAGSLQ